MPYLTIEEQMTQKKALLAQCKSNIVEYFDVAQRIEDFLSKEKKDELEIMEWSLIMARPKLNYLSSIQPNFSEEEKNAIFFQRLGFLLDCNQTENNSLATNIESFMVRNQCSEEMRYSIYLLILSTKYSISQYLNQKKESTFKGMLRQWADFCIIYSTKEAIKKELFSNKSLSEEQLLARCEDYLEGKILLSDDFSFPTISSQELEECNRLIKYFLLSDASGGLNNEEYHLRFQEKLIRYLEMSDDRLSTKAIIDSYINCISRNYTSATDPNIGYLMVKLIDAKEGSLVKIFKSFEDNASFLKNNYLSKMDNAIQALIKNILADSEVDALDRARKQADVLTQERNKQKAYCIKTFFKQWDYYYTFDVSILSIHQQTETPLSESDFLFMPKTGLRRRITQNFNENSSTYYSSPLSSTLYSKSKKTINADISDNKNQSFFLSKSKSD